MEVRSLKHQILASSYLYTLFLPIFWTFSGSIKLNVYCLKTISFHCPQLKQWICNFLSYNIWRVNQCVQYIYVMKYLLAENFKIECKNQSQILFHTHTTINISDFKIYKIWNWVLIDSQGITFYIMSENAIKIQVQFT